MARTFFPEERTDSVKILIKKYEIAEYLPILQSD